MNEAEQMSRCNAARRLSTIRSSKTLSIGEEKFLTAHLSVCPACSLEHDRKPTNKIGFFTSMLCRLGLRRGY